MIEANFTKEMIDDYILIKADHVEEGLEKAGVKRQNFTDISGFESDCEAVEDFMDVVEETLSKHFADYAKVTQADFIMFLPAKTQIGINPAPCYSQRRLRLLFFRSCFHIVCQRTGEYV